MVNGISGMERSRANMVNKQRFKEKQATTNI